MVLLIGIGNTLRRDDGIGPLLAEQLAAQLAARGVPVEWLATQQLTPDFAAVIDEAAPAAVVFVDADTDCAEVAITRIVENGALAAGSHSLDPALLLYLAQQLYGWSGPAWLVRVPAVDFAHGEGFSPTTQLAFEQVGVLAEQLGALLRAG